MITWKRQLGVLALRPDDIIYRGSSTQGVSYVVVSSPDTIRGGRNRYFRAYRIVDNGRRFPAGRGGELRTRQEAYAQAEADLAQVTADAEAVATPADVPAPRAERFAQAFTEFNSRADSGGPGTARGVVRAVEVATAITAEQLDRMVRTYLLSGRRGTRPRLAEALIAVGFDVERGPQ